MTPNLLSAAESAITSGRLSDGEALLRRYVAENPQDRKGKLLLGISLARQGKDEEAESTLKESQESAPASLEALFWLSILARRSGRRREAAQLAREAASLSPRSAPVLNNLGYCEMEAQNLQAALNAFRQTVALEPRNPTGYFNLATCLALLGRDEEALQMLGQSAALAPPSVEVQLAIAKSLLNLNKIEGAIEVAQEALRRQPHSATVHRLLALAYMHGGNSESALRHARRAVELEPEEGLSYATLGSVLQSAGSLEESNAAFLKSIDLLPKQGHAYFSLVHNRRLKESDRQLLSRMEELISSAELAPKDLSNLYYGLGKGYEDLGEFERAMQNYDEANRIARDLKFGGRPYDPKEAADSTNLKMRRYTPALFERAEKESLQTDKPIFIVGMMRSGTTLVEQILSSHPEVEAGGEIDFWVNRGLECLDSRGLPDLAKLKSLAAEYVQILDGISVGARHVTDKMPSNYLALGVIHAALPNARIIHMRRNPADTAISIYATPNRTRIDFAHDKASIVSAYKEYLRLTSYWRKVLPPNRLLEVCYEELIDDRERVTREIAKFCDLQWSDAMLAPERNERSVVTPSVWQVRQPLYRTSMERWKRFEPWLGPFRELLALTEAE